MDEAMAFWGIQKNVVRETGGLGAMWSTQGHPAASDKSNPYVPLLGYS